MSVGASSFSTVGIRNSDFGLLELTWNPEPMRNLIWTVPDLPRGMVVFAGSDIVIDGATLPEGMSEVRSWATEKSWQPSSEIITALLQFRTVRRTHGFMQSRLQQYTLLSAQLRHDQPNIVKSNLVRHGVLNRTQLLEAQTRAGSFNC